MIKKIEKGFASTPSSAPEATVVEMKSEGVLCSSDINFWKDNNWTW